MKVTTATLTLLGESISLTMGPFRGQDPKLGSDSVYSKHNGAKQNRKDRHIVLGLPSPFVALPMLAHPGAQLYFCSSQKHF